MKFFLLLVAFVTAAKPSEYSVPEYIVLGRDLSIDEATIELLNEFDQKKSKDTILTDVAACMSRAKTCRDQLRAVLFYKAMTEFSCNPLECSLFEAASLTMDEVPFLPLLAEKIAAIAMPLAVPNQELIFFDKQLHALYTSLNHRDIVINSMAAGNLERWLYIDFKKAGQINYFLTHYLPLLMLEHQDKVHVLVKDVLLDKSSLRPLIKLLIMEFVRTPNSLSSWNSMIKAICKEFLEDYSEITKKALTLLPHT